MDLTLIIKKHNIKGIVPLNKGWSSDKKYILTDYNENKFILRISDKDVYEKRFNQYQLLKSLESLNLNYPKAVDFGYLDDDNIYLLLTYLEGEPAEEKIYKFNYMEQYRLGYQTGQMLKNIHSFKTEKNSPSWWEKYQAKSIRKIDAYLSCPIKHENSEFLINYYKDNMYLMKDRPQVLCHGDYHLGNMLINENAIVVIDFDKLSIADPYDEFKPYNWNVVRSEYFETGLINGYFDNNIPSDFFKILKFYTIEGIISHLPWAMTFGEEEVKTALKMYQEALKWYDNFNLEIPTWYKGVVKW